MSTPIFTTTTEDKYGKSNVIDSMRSLPYTLCTNYEIHNYLHIVFIPIHNDYN